MEDVSGIPTPLNFHGGEKSVQLVRIHCANSVISETVKLPSRTANRLSQSVSPTSRSRVHALCESRFSASDSLRTDSSHRKAGIMRRIREGRGGWPLPNARIHMMYIPPLVFGLPLCQMAEMPRGFVARRVSDASEQDDSVPAYTSGGVRKPLWTCPRQPMVDELRCWLVVLG